MPATDVDPYTLHLTAAGRRFLQGTDDHPLLPGFVDRLVTRCAGLPDDVQSLLIDARACLDHMLTRPSIVLMGVAYEVAIEHVIGSLVRKTHLASGAANQKAAMRIDSVKSVIDTVLTNSEDRFAAKDAYDFAHQLRRRRNDASHTTPRYDFSDRAEAEECLVSAGRHLPHIWLMYRP